MKSFLRNLLTLNLLFYILTPALTNEILEITLNTTTMTEKSKLSEETTTMLTAKQNRKRSEKIGNRNDQQSSSSEVKRAAKSPLVLRLLQEQLEDGISNQLSYPAVSPTLHQLPSAYSIPEEKDVHYQQESEGGIEEEEKGTSTLDDIEPTMPTRYQYVYKVKDMEGNDFGHSETREGEKTWGRYFVQLPDGREKTVKYWADDTGFHAEVEYRGQAIYPSGGKKYKRI